MALCSGAPNAFGTFLSWQQSELGSEGHRGTSTEQEPDPGEVTEMHSLTRETLCATRGNEF